jgi:hypothetical protein
MNFVLSVKEEMNVLKTIKANYIIFSKHAY